MPRDGQIRLPDGGAPTSYTIPNAVELIPKAINATFDGTGAGSAFVPTVVIESDGGVVIARVPCQTTVAAGGSAECTFAPFLRAEAATGGSLAGVKQGVYNAPNQSVGSGGSFADAAWTYQSGDAVLNLSTPAQPSVVATGLYIFTIAFSIAGGGTAGRTFQGNIQLDTAFPRNMVSEILNPSGGFGVTGHNSDAAVMTAGQTLRFRLVNNDSSAHNMNMQEAHVVYVPTS